MMDKKHFEGTVGEWIPFLPCLIGTGNVAPSLSVRLPNYPELQLQIPPPLSQIRRC